MKISILTPSFNQGRYIESNIISVMNQNWPDIEHIIIDGGSEDETVSILSKYDHLTWVSEPDKGQADALNKGLELATGDIIGWINSDDYYSYNIFQQVVSAFYDLDVMWIIGNIIHVYPIFGYEVPKPAPKVTYDNLIRNPNIVTQQGAFYRKSELIKIGGWDHKFYMTMDLDLWIRLSKRTEPKMIDEYWAYFTHHSKQKTSSHNLLHELNDIRIIFKREKAPYRIAINIIVRQYYYFIKAIIKNLMIKAGLIDIKYSNIPLSIKKHI